MFQFKLTDNIPKFFYHFLCHGYIKMGLYPFISTLTDYFLINYFPKILLIHLLSKIHFYIKFLFLSKNILCYCTNFPIHYLPHHILLPFFSKLQYFYNLQYFYFIFFFLSFGVSFFNTSFFAKFYRFSTLISFWYIFLLTFD